MHPAIVMASLIYLNETANAKHTVTKTNVTIAFILVLIPYFFQNNSSTVSLAGKTHKGAAVNIAKNNAKFP